MLSSFASKPATAIRLVFLALDLGCHVSVASPMMTLGMSPVWIMSHEFINEDSMMEGKLQLQLAWNMTAAIQALGAEASKDLRSVPVVTNFAGAKGSTLTAGPIVETGEMAGGSRFFIGAFKQVLDEACFPFDHVEADFNIEILRPFRDMVKLSLFCECDDAVCGDECRSYDPFGQSITSNKVMNVAKIVRKNTIGDFVGFTWEEFACELRPGNYAIRCSMKGVRDPELKVLSDLLTGVVMVGVGFASVWMKPTPALTMPRVATTMIALLTFIAKGSAVMGTAPDTGGLSWLGHFFIAGIFVMAIVMVGHIETFRRGREHRWLRIFNRYFSFFGFILFLFIDLLGRDCSHVPGAVPIAGLVGGVILSLVSIVLCIYDYRVEASALLNRKKDDPLPRMATLPLEEKKKDDLPAEDKYADHVSLAVADMQAQYEQRIAALTLQLQEAEVRCKTAESQSASGKSPRINRQEEQGAAPVINVLGNRSFSAQTAPLVSNPAPASTQCCSMQSTSPC